MVRNLRRILVNNGRPTVQDRLSRHRQTPSDNRRTFIFVLLMSTVKGIQHRFSRAFGLAVQPVSQRMANLRPGLPANPIRPLRHATSQLTTHRIAPWLNMFLTTMRHFFTRCTIVFATCFFSTMARNHTRIFVNIRRGTFQTRLSRHRQTARHHRLNINFNRHTARTLSLLRVDLIV